jgi:hypothetical protein
MVDTDENVVYYFRHVRENAYANKDGLRVKDWKNAITFNNMRDADEFYIELFRDWDMCQCSPELWEASGGRMKVRNHIQINNTIIYLD